METMTTLAPIPLIDPLTTPWLPAQPTGNGITVRVWCRYCDRFHIHGDPTTGGLTDGTPHRVSHCHIDNSPYKENGYFLKLVSSEEHLLPPRSERRKPKYVRSHILHGWS